MVEDCSALNWAVVGDATALGTIAYFDALLRDAEFAEQVKPDVVVRLGGLPASRILQERLREWKRPNDRLRRRGLRLGPRSTRQRTYSRGYRILVHEPKADGEYLRLWSEASTLVGEWLANVDDDDALNELVGRSLRRRRRVRAREVPLVDRVVDARARRRVVDAAAHARRRTRIAA